MAAATQAKASESGPAGESDFDARNRDAAVGQHHGRRSREGNLRRSTSASIGERDNEGGRRSRTFVRLLRSRRRLLPLARRTRTREPRRRRPSATRRAPRAGVEATSAHAAITTSPRPACGGNEPAVLDRAHRVVVRKFGHERFASRDRRLGATIGGRADRPPDTLRMLDGTETCQVPPDFVGHRPHRGVPPALAGNPRPAGPRSTSRPRRRRIRLARAPADAQELARTPLRQLRRGSASRPRRGALLGRKGPTPPERPGEAGRLRRSRAPHRAAGTVTLARDELLTRRRLTSEGVQRLGSLRRALATMRRSTTIDNHPNRLPEASYVPEDRPRAAAECRKEVAHHIRYDRVGIRARDAPTHRVANEAILIELVEGGPGTLVPDAARAREHDVFERRARDVRRNALDRRQESQSLGSGASRDAERVGFFERRLGAPER